MCKMISLRRNVVIALLCLVITACATGPQFAEVQSTLPQLAESKGRIYFYRSANPFGSAVQPSVLLNGEKVGDSVPNGVFLRDVPPGKYEVSLSTEVEKKLTFTLEAGEEKFVRMSISLGLFVGRVIPELVNPEVGRQEISGLAYTGS